ncbi:hypothetical protein WOLCODRAFT_135522 [Wolfiporia cocos MD-104 SS10]|uniref:Uncharacterized protein n=1 Tax=Wolfiporia cocos (strain MD-104) TaxID=742152 RepID=A0A2H3J5V8_WOLCO|nr:hypothetical protein WOLCODRAFT_135522 [Wolfiporia cocos MD-104 SS10]
MPSYEAENLRNRLQLRFLHHNSPVRRGPLYLGAMRSSNMKPHRDLGRIRLLAFSFSPLCQESSDFSLTSRDVSDEDIPEDSLSLSVSQTIFLQLNRIPVSR